MVNVTVIRGKDIIKYILKITLVILLTIGITKFFIQSKKEKQDVKISQVIEEARQQIQESSAYMYINKTIPFIEDVNNTNEIEQNESETNKNIVQKLLLAEIGMIDSLSKIEEVQPKEQEKVASSENEENKQNPVNISSELQEGNDTEVIESGIKTTYTNISGSVEIKNESSYSLTEEMLIPNVNIADKKDILIFHTHTCESYTPSVGYEYETSGTYRTTDLNFSVARVGAALTEYLSGYNYNVIHDTTYHDYPAYSGSYTRSLETVNSILGSNPSCEIVFDIHRDAIGSNSDYAPTVRIGEEYAAQLMFVIGTDGGGLEHPNWLNNLQFAIAIQETANKMYPGLFKPMIVRNSRYNQHVTNAAAIVEVGATGNTMEQCITSMKYLAKVISEVVKE